MSDNWQLSPAEVFDAGGMSKSNSDISFGYRLFSIDETSSLEQIVVCKQNIYVCRICISVHIELLKLYQISMN